ncbi:MAG: hypothetical protein ACT4P6_15400, partial [Gemmatimonadaceae bacterium]
MIDTLKRHAIQVLRQAGHTLEEIAAQVAVGKRSVQRVVDEPMSTSITDVVRDPALARRRPGRRSKVAAYRDHVTAWLK